MKQTDSEVVLMKVAAVIAEYNPFHNGHKYHLDMTRRLTGADCVIVFMSGEFVQRGEPAVAPKRERAKIALMNGADLVFELPAPWSFSTAERFARAGVYLAIHTGQVNYLSFGAETGNVELLSKVADFCGDRHYAGVIRTYYENNHCSFPEARAAVVKADLGDDAAELLSKPNNILAVEYLKALKFYRSNIQPVAVTRYEAGHDSEMERGGMLSALAIRNRIKAGKDYAGFMPENAYAILENAKNDGLFPADFRKLEISILADMRRKTPEEISLCPDIAEGIENRIYEAAGAAGSIDELCALVKTKRYAYSRIRRIILNSYLGVKNTDIVDALPPYLRVLGFNETGLSVLRDINKDMSYPVVSIYRDVKRAGKSAEHIFELGARCADMYNLCLPEVRPRGCDKTDEIIKV